MSGAPRSVLAAATSSAAAPPPASDATVAPGEVEARPGRWLATTAVDQSIRRGDDGCPATEGAGRGHRYMAKSSLSTTAS